MVEKGCSLCQVSSLGELSILKFSIQSLQGQGDIWREEGEVGDCVGMNEGRGRGRMLHHTSTGEERDHH